MFPAALQDRLLYFPDRYEHTALARLAEARGLQAWPAEAAYRGFLMEAPGPETRGTVAVFHGNAGSAANRSYYRDLLPQDLRVVLLEYPGYGARPGELGEAALVADGAESLKLLRESFEGPLYVLGESLGAAVAAGAVAASRVVPAGLILCAPWDDLVSVARSLYWFLPVRSLLRDRYDSLAYLRDYRGPLAVIVAERDELIPRASSLRLYDAYPGAKRLWLPPGGHNTWLSATDAGWWREVFHFLDGHAGR